MSGRWVGVIGVLLALWMTLGRWLFGAGGTLTWWYLPTIGLVYAALSCWLGWRITRNRARGKRNGRAIWVSLVLSWVCAFGFGVTVPDQVGGEVVTMLGSWTGSSLATELAIAFCNPLGIIAFACLIAALGFAYAAGRDPRPEEDE